MTSPDTLILKSVFDSKKHEERALKLDLSALSPKAI